MDSAHFRKEIAGYLPELNKNCMCQSGESSGESHMILLAADGFPRQRTDFQCSLSSAGCIIASDMVVVNTKYRRRYGKVTIVG